MFRLCAGYVPVSAISGESVRLNLKFHHRDLFMLDELNHPIPPLRLDLRISSAPICSFPYHSPDGLLPSLGRDPSRPPRGQLEFGT